MGSLEQACITGFLCRLCSKMHRSVIHIYGREGLKHDLEKKINNYLPVTVSESDPLPKTICENCMMRVQNHHELMMQIKRNNLIFTKFRTATEARRVRMIVARRNEIEANQSSSNAGAATSSDDEVERELASIVRGRSRSPLIDMSAITSNSNENSEEEENVDDELMSTLYSPNGNPTHSDLSTSDEDLVPESEPESE